MSGYSKNEKLNFYNERKLDSSKMWFLFLFFGWSYGSLKQMGKQIGFYLTFGGFGLWTLYVLFTLSGKVKKYNKEVARQVGLEESDVTMLGLND